MEHLSLDLGQCRGRWWMDRHVGEDQPLLVVALAQDFVLAQEKFVPHAESGIATKLTVKKKNFLFASFYTEIIVRFVGGDDLAGDDEADRGRDGISGRNSEEVEELTGE